MMKYIKGGILALSIFLINFCLITYKVASRENFFEEINLGESFKIESYEISGVIEMNSTKDLKDIGLDIFEKSGLGGEAKINITDKVEIKIKSGDLVGKILTVKKDEGRVYARFTLSQHMGKKNINNMRRYVFHGLKGLGSQPSFSTLIKGRMNSVIDLNEMNQYAKEIFNKNKVKLLDEFKDGNMISICGYSNKIDEINLYKGKKMNLNIALRCSKSQNCTYIWIGSPIIYDEY